MVDSSQSQYNGFLFTELPRTKQLPCTIAVNPKQNNAHQAIFTALAVTKNNCMFIVGWTVGPNVETFALVEKLVAWKSPIYSTRYYCKSHRTVWIINFPSGLLYGPPTVTYQLSFPFRNSACVTFPLLRTALSDLLITCVSLGENVLGRRTTCFSRLSVVPTFRRTRGWRIFCFWWAEETRTVLSPPADTAESGWWLRIKAGRFVADSRVRTETRANVQSVHVQGIWNPTRCVQLWNWRSVHQILSHSCWSRIRFIYGSSRSQVRLKIVPIMISMKQSYGLPCKTDWSIPLTYRTGAP